MSYNTDLLQVNITSIMGYIDLLKQNKKTDLFEIEMEIMNNYPEFYEQYPFLVKKLCKGEDLGILYKMIEGLKKVESGEKTLTQVELPLGQELADEYLYPSLRSTYNLRSTDNLSEESDNLSEESDNLRPTKKLKK
jgi:hypothetical protein